MERRRDKRFDLAGTMVLDAGGQRYRLPAVDISRTGLGVLLDAEILGQKPNGQVWACTIESNDLARPVQAFVSVMRIRQFRGQQLVGFRFESIDDEDLRIIRAYEMLAKIRAGRKVR